MNHTIRWSAPTVVLTLLLTGASVTAQAPKTATPEIAKQAMATLKRMADFYQTPSA